MDDKEKREGGRGRRRSKKEEEGVESRRKGKQPCFR